MSHYSRHGSVLGSVHGYDEDEWGAAHDEQSTWGPPDRPGPRLSNPFSPSPAGSPSAYTFSSRQRTWSGGGDGGSRRGSGSYSGSFEERLPPPPQPPPPNGFAIPVRGSAAHARRPGSNADRDGDWHPPPGHRVRRSYESGSGGGGSDAGGSYGSRRGSLLSSEAQRLGYGGTPTVEEERDQAWERERVREMERERERERERELECERDREIERERERERQERRERRARRERKERKEQQQKRDRETEERARLRQRLRRETQAYPRRLLVYLRSVFRSQQVMEHAVEVFSKLDQDPRYLAQSAGVLLESLAAVGDKSDGDGTGLGDADDSDDEEGGKGDGDAEEDEGDDDDEDDENDDESEEDASKDSSDDDLGAKDDSTGLSEDDDDDSVGDVKDHIVPGRRARYDERLDSIGSTARRLRSGGGSMSAHRKGSSSGGGPESGTSPASFMRWSGLRPYALNRDPAAVDDRCKSFLALTQIIGASTLVLPVGGADEEDEEDGDEDDGDGPPEPPRSPRSSRKRSPPPPPPKKKQQPQRVLSTNGLLAELRRVLRPRDYRAYFRASSARVIMLPLDTTSSGDGVGSGSNGSFGGGGSMGGGSMRRLSRQPMDETALEALERRLLNPTQFVPSPAAPPTAPLTTMACLTYSCASSSSFGSITLYRVELAVTGSAASARGVPRRLPRRIVPVAVMTGVPKELLRQTARAVPPECRTVLRAEADGIGGGYRCRSVALPDSTATVPAVLYAAADAGRPRLSAGFCAMLGIAPDGRSVRVARTASSSSSSSTSSSLAPAAADAKTAANDHAVGVQATVASLVAWLHVRAAYLTDVRLDVVAAPAPAASPTAKTTTDKTSKAAKTTATKAMAKTAAKTATTKAAQRADEATTSRPQTVQWSHGPAAIDHEGRDPCLVVLHPNAPWALAPLLLVERQP